MIVLCILWNTCMLFENEFLHKKQNMCFIITSFQDLTGNYYVRCKAEMHKNQWFFGTGMKFAKNVLKAPSRI